MRITALLLSLALSSANAADDYAMRLLRDWTLSVDQHAAGQPDAALERVTRWSYGDLELMRGYIDAVFELPLNTRARDLRRRVVGGDAREVREQTRQLQRRGDFDDFTKRAVVLHTDAALLGSPPPVLEPPMPGQPRAPGSSAGANRSLIVKSFDGRVENFELKNLHWDYAMDVLEALPATPRRDPIVAQWYRAIGAYLVRERRFGDAATHFDRARRLLPDDPRIMFGEATLNETLGAPRIQNYVKVATLPIGLVIRGVSSPDTHWKRAEERLRRAIAVDPQFAEARLRLGRVVIQQRRYEEGLTLVQQAAAELASRAMRYYARLFAGDAQQSLGRADDARASYQLALELFPGSQAARIGLASVLRATGDRERARAVLFGPADAVEPWWDYYDGDAAQVDEMLAELWAPFRNPRP